MSSIKRLRNMYFECTIFLYIACMIVYGSHIVITHPDSSITLTINAVDITGLACIMSGSPEVNIEWNWRGQFTKEPTYYFTAVSADFPISGNIRGYSATLNWKNTTSLEERKQASGTLYASASHDGDTTVCNDVILNIEWSPTTASITPSGIVTILPAEELQVLCSSPDKGNPIGTVVWTKDTIIQTEYTNDLLTIESIKTTDTGTWRCSYTNKHGTSDYSPLVDVQVIWVPTAATITPSGVVTLIRGEELKLTCSSSDKGNHSGIVVWTKGTNIQTEHTNEVLTIDSIKATDSGMWKCNYKNDHGSSTYSQTVDVQVMYPASGVTLTLSSVDPFKKGDSFVMSCVHSDPGNPVAELFFKVNDITLANLERINSSTYRVNSISSYHNGSLKCCYNNKAAEACSDTHNLLIQWDVSTDASIKLSDQNKDVLKGDNVKLVCELSDKGFPEAIVTWTHNDTVKCGENNYNLTIKYVQYSDSGEWSCSAANGFSRSNDAVYTLNVRPKSTQANASTIIAAVFGSLLMVSTVALVIFICLYYRQKKNNKGGSAQKETTVHYVNIGSATNAGAAPNTPASPEYEDVRESATSNGQSGTTENTTYMDLDQNDVQQTRNRPAELTVYQSLN